MLIKDKIQKPKNSKSMPLKIYLISSLLLMYQLKCTYCFNEENSYERTNYDKTNYGRNDRINYGKYAKNYQTYEQPNYHKYASSRISTSWSQNHTAVEAVEIPYPVIVGENVKLKCKWTVGVTGFYSLRWYKNGEQFYSYLKGGSPQTHDLKGIHVTIPESDDHVLTLREVTPDVEGIYKCEIMGEGPRFKISHKSANLTVVELPETPTLLGIKHMYHIGDTLNVTCTAANGRPAPDLVVKVNGVSMQRESGRLIDLPQSDGDRPGVFTSRARLVLALSDAHTPTFTLSCLAYAHGLLVKKEVVINVDRRQHFFGMFFSGGGISIVKFDCRKIWWLVSLVIIVKRFCWEY